jgi:exopolysaccharide production protein ExoZ
MVVNTYRCAKHEPIEGLQYLRGIAALMVVFYHSRSYFGEVPEWTRLGSRGVDIFFVVSGFVMAYTTHFVPSNRSAIRESFTFFARRLVRVVPLYWIALLWACAPFWSNWLAGTYTPTDANGQMTHEIKTIIKDFLFIPHLSIDEDEQGEVFPVLITGWTLNYEMFFYLLFAIAMGFRQYRLIAVSVVLISLVAIGQCFHFNRVLSAFYTSSILIEFVFGILLFELFRHTQEITLARRYKWLLGGIGVLLLNSGSLTNDKLVLAAAATLIAWVFIHSFRDWRIGALRVLGDASYAIYLFHLAAFSAAREVIGYLQLAPVGYLNIATIIVIQVGLATACGIAVHYWAERPLLSILRPLVTAGRGSAMSRGGVNGSP